MNTISSQFNTYAQWEASLWPLYITVLIDEPEHQRKRRRRTRLSKMQRAFWQASMNESRDRYVQQVEQRYAKPRNRIPSPGF